MERLCWCAVSREEPRGGLAAAFQKGSGEKSSTSAYVRLFARGPFWIKRWR